MTEIMTIDFWKDLKSGRFVSMVKETSKGQFVSNSNEVYNIMKPLYAQEDDIEKVYFIFLNAKNKILGIEKLFSGSISSSTIYTREIAKRIFELKAVAIIMVHSHPSGDSSPSAEDMSITIKVGIAAASLDVNFHDHIIIGNGYYSMADNDYMKEISNRFSKLLLPLV